MNDLRGLYQEIILDHYKRPRHHGVATGANREAEGFNPLCGDKVKVTLAMKDGTIEDVAFEGEGCAISTASASLMTEALHGKTEAEARELFQRFRQLLTGGEVVDEEELGKLAALSGVRDYPMRVKCATLAWHTLQAALDKADDAVSTE
ncbi:MAG: SUF system NifU family Fe-S cluster assembly protein [Thermoanaerobaculia bacterium]|nr:SUF system NifU family Fe-S cluster assembly protein [Thermoanaerobaculia bacterium]